MSLAALTPLAQHAAYYLSLASPYLALAACLFALLALIANTTLERRLSRLALGKNGSIEESIAILSREIKELRIFRAELETYLKNSETRLRGSIQGIGIVRFNPFSSEGQGGNQSFAAAFLDEMGHGVVFSTLYARDRVGVYAKPIENGHSTYELSGEELQALQKAQTAIVERKKGTSAHRDEQRDERRPKV